MNPVDHQLRLSFPLGLVGAACSLFLLLLLVPKLTPAQENGVPMASRPPLPQRSPQNWTMPKFRMEHAAVIYDTWKSGCKKIADLSRASSVRALGKLSVVYQPDEISITTPMPKLGLNSGEVIYRYTVEGEGFADFWINGRWYKEYDGSFIVESNGDGCSKNCTARVAKNGRKEDWSHIRLPDGRDGWFHTYNEE
jgi:hypothetical protein